MEKNERRLLSKALYDITLDVVVAGGVTEEMFADVDCRRVYAYGGQFMQTHQRPPTPIVIRNEFPGFKLVREVEEPLTYWIERVQKDYAKHRALEFADQLGVSLDDNDPARFFEVAADAAKFTAVAAPGKTVDIIERLAELKEILLSRSTTDGLLGIDTGFSTINNATLGWQPSQLVTVAGLGGAGKSTLLMLMARRAQAQGKRPYFMSFEMGEDEQSLRYMAMAIGVPYKRIVAGRLTTEEWGRYDRVLGQKDAAFLLCTDITRSSTVPGLESELKARTMPDVAFIDGVYMMRDHQTKSSGTAWDAMTNITRDLKQLAQRLEIPIVISTQALPGKTSKARGTSRRRLDMYSPGYSSSFAQDSDVMFGLEHDESYPDERTLRVTKARHCAPYTVRIEWNWRTASFGTELEVIDGDEEGEDDDDDV